MKSIGNSLHAWLGVTTPMKQYPWARDRPVHFNRETTPFERGVGGLALAAP